MQITRYKYVQLDVEEFLEECFFSVEFDAIE